MYLISFQYVQAAHEQQEVISLVVQLSCISPITSTLRFTIYFCLFLCALVAAKAAKSFCEFGPQYFKCNVYHSWQTKNINLVLN